MEKKFKLNVVDIIAVLLIIAVLAFVGYKLVKRGGVQAAEPQMITVDYTVKCEGVSRELYENCQKHLPSQLMASGELYDGQINSVSEAPYYVLAPTGEWVEDTDHVTLYFQVEASIPKTDVMTTEIATQEVRVGRNDYILKSQYIEFSDCIITDVEWSE
jgi:hypothetical protein